MLDILLFDLDGTLTDPKEGITKSVQYALSSFGIEENCDNLLPFIGPPLFDSFCKYYNMNAEDSEKAVAKYRERFSVKGLYENKVYDGVENMLEQLKKNGKTIVLCTAKPLKYASIILDYFDLTKYFDLVVGSDFHGPLRNKTDVIGYIINKIGEDKKGRMIMIGDRDNDILGAKEFGIKSLGVRFGYAEENELEDAGADYIVDTMDELFEMLKNI